MEQSYHVHFLSLAMMSHILLCWNMGQAETGGQRTVETHIRLASAVRKHSHSAGDAHHELIKSISRFQQLRESGTNNPTLVFL